MRGFALALVFAVIVFGSFILGVLTQSPELMMVWLCLHPFAWFALGRASIGLMRQRRIAVLSER